MHLKLLKWRFSVPVKLRGMIEGLIFPPSICSARFLVGNRRSSQVKMVNHLDHLSRGFLTFQIGRRQGKTILIAVYSHLPEIQRALWRMTGAALAGCVLGILCGFGKITWPKRCSASIAAAAFLGLCIENHALRIVLNTSCDLGTIFSRVQMYEGSW